MCKHLNEQKLYAYGRYPYTRQYFKCVRQTLCFYIFLVFCTMLSPSLSSTLHSLLYAWVYHYQLGTAVSCQVIVSLTISIRIVVLIILLEQSLFVVQFRFSFQGLLTPSYSVVFGVVLIFGFSPRACL